MGLTRQHDSVADHGASFGKGVQAGTPRLLSRRSCAIVSTSAIYWLYHVAFQVERVDAVVGGSAVGDAQR